ncbi:hypothetical protein OCHUTO_0337 [Orientia chuto str. Dubai]|uniref:Uncharacterized protein n=1 Tax=Orientia chuto str. Dubai TaxID=1359168 RepID=A0A0F3MMQ4_9RICK|nr:hypothetical protein OCHUTO_0337 [Orientia chuto str. Dubai]
MQNISFGLGGIRRALREVNKICIIILINIEFNINLLVTCCLNKTTKPSISTKFYNSKLRCQS